jgi:hypothetical protein
MAKTLALRGVPEEKVSTVLNWDAGSPARSVDTRRASDASLRFVYPGARWPSAASRQAAC